jgi:citrate lyase beta subunit
MIHSRRALLYMPGDDLHKIQKAITLNVDCICMDIEDGVALNRKASARETIIQALSSLEFGESERLVRVNGIQTEFFEKDLTAVLSAHPDGIVIPKIENAETIQLVSQKIDGVEKTNGWPLGSMTIIATVETARGILNLRAICQSDLRLSALIFGAEDLAVNLGATRTAEGWEIFHARSEIIMYCAAFGLQAIDIVNNDYRDLEALQKEALLGARMGFSGKQVIHPNQVAVVQEAFAPSLEEVIKAKELVKLYTLQQKKGKGALGIAGRLIDMPVFRQSENILARAKATGRLTPHDEKESK